MIINIAEVRRLNKEKGHHWFSPETTRFFNSRYPQTARLIDKRAYFVTSEQFDYSSPRLYTLRVCDMETGDIETMGAFQQYQTSQEANQALKSLAG